MSLKRVPNGGSVLLHTCEVCGAAASFGTHVSFRLAMNKLAAGDVTTAKRLLGKWFCGEHRPSAGGGRA